MVSETSSMVLFDPDVRVNDVIYAEDRSSIEMNFLFNCILNTMSR